MYGNFAAMNELATKEPTAKKARKSRRDPRAAPDMEALMSQMAGGGMAEMMNQMAGGGMAEMLKGLGGGDMAGMAEMLKGLGGSEGLAEMMKGLEGETRPREHYPHPFLPCVTLLLTAGVAAFSLISLYFSIMLSPSSYSFRLFYKGQDMGSLMAQGMGMWKQMLESPDMQAVLSNPEQMREMMLPFVEMMGGDMAKLEEVLADPEKLKSSMNEGLEVMSYIARTS